jgi:uncharacterized protein YcfJ
MKKSIVFVTGLALLLPGMAQADQRTRHVWDDADKHVRHAEQHARQARQHWRKAHAAAYHNSRSKQEERVYGRVLAVEPVYRLYSYEERNDTCVRWREDMQPVHSWTPTVLGGVIGAAVGYGLGEDHGDPEVATVAGTLLGATVGRDLGRHLLATRQLQVRGPCTPAPRESQSAAPVEYVVTYRYNGEVYRKRMNYDPGEWVALNVEVSPA